MTTPNGGGRPVNVALKAGVAQRVWTADNPAGCTVINLDPAAAIALGDDGSVQIGTGQPLGPLQSATRQARDLYAVSSIDCLLQVIDGIVNYAQVGTPQRTVDAWDHVGAWGANQASNFANTAPGDTSGSNRAVITYTATGSNNSLTISIYYPSLNLTTSVASVPLYNGGTGGATLVASADISILQNVPYIVQGTTTQNYSAGLTCHVALVPE